MGSQRSDVMKKLINSVDSVVIDAAAPPAGTVDAERPEITRSWGVPVNTPAFRWER